MYTFSGAVLRKGRQIRGLARVSRYSRQNRILQGRFRLKKSLLELLHVFFYFQKGRVGANRIDGIAVASMTETEELTEHLQRWNLKGGEASSAIKHRNFGQDQLSRHANLHLTRYVYNSNQLAENRRRRPSSASVHTCAAIILPALGN